MDRKTTYRMWDKKENRFRYKNEARISPEGNVYCNDYAGGPENDRFVAQLFTGKFDKNGKEIYDGDFLEATTAAGGGWKKVLHRVFWDDKIAGFSTEFWAEYFTKPRFDDQPLHFLFNTNHVTVVGNIFENASLIGKHYPSEKDGRDFSEWLANESKLHRNPDDGGFVQ